LRRLCNFINGESVAPKSAKYVELINPGIGQPMAEMPVSNDVDIDDAAQAALKAFQSWKRTTPSQRSSALLKIADVLEAHAEELVAVEAENCGKIISVTMSEEIPPMLDQIRFFAGTARLLEARGATEYMEGMTSYVRREPVGVCGAVTPWNYPMMMAVWKWAPAIAAGNTMVLKPGDSTPASTLLMAQLMAEVLPAGVFNVVCGDREAGARAGRAPDTCDCLGDGLDSCRHGSRFLRVKDSQACAS
jgi:betaine-aldehyde dehydrogenase